MTSDRDRRDRDARKRTLTGSLPASAFADDARAAAVSGGSSAPAPSGADRAADHDLPEVGTVIDRYRIEEMIGAGGFAVVFRARHLALDMPVAIKLIRPSLLRKWPNLAATLCEEARLAARLNHPNVMRVHDVVQTDRVTFVAMELIEGENLSQLIARRGPLRPARVLRIGLAVALGLRAGLSERVIHRDIKPANILLTRGGTIKIVDLGLARQMTSDGESRAARGGLIGTPGYMAPEQIDDPDGVDFRADIYALGVTLFHALVGRPPFSTDDPVQAMALHQSAPMPAPSQFVADLPPALDRLLLWMLARRPDRRPGSYDLLIASIRRALEDLDRD